MTQQTPSRLDTLPAALRDASPSGDWSIRKRRGPWRDALRRRMLAGADVLALVISGWLASTLTVGPSAGTVALTLPLWVVLAKLYGLYDQDHRALRHLTVDELRGLVAWLITGTVTSTLLLSILGEDGSLASYALHLWGVAILLVPASRAAARSLWRRLVPRERALLIGSGPLEAATRRKLELFADIHVTCIGVVDDSALGSLDAVQVATGSLEELRHVDASRIDRIIVASGAVTEALVADQVRLCRRHGIKLSVVPPARAMFGTAVRLHHIADLPMIEYSTWDTARSTMLVKRSLDVALSAVLLVMFAPVLLLTAVLVRLTSPGPVLFVQQRGGRDGRPFNMLKFRTMVEGAHERVQDVVDFEGLEAPMFKLRGDPRITSVGRWLRRTSLDELPQLFNVLKGDMSLVGPRPEQTDLIERYSPEHRFRLAVKPGVTGPMQVSGRGELRFDERLAVEREYVENLSVERDLRILLLTVATVFGGRGAY